MKGKGMESKRDRKWVLLSIAGRKGLLKMVPLEWIPEASKEPRESLGRLLLKEEII